MEYKALPFSSVWENGIFNLPTKLVDEYLKLASEYQLKALLYIFRNNGQASTNAVAKALGQTVNDTDNLLEFWVEEGILSVDGNIVAQEIVPKRPCNHSWAPHWPRSGCVTPVLSQLYS